MRPGHSGRREDRNYHRIERAYGSFVRSFSLPRSVDPSQIVVNYRNGVLEVEIPKKEEAKPPFPSHRIAPACVSTSAARSEN
ncbi:MAG TPA: Hsp20 family protein [Thermoanaerobaculia bacterium]|nr:Hsp20 family protein [Thermoanaerobaculia bacterium]